MAVQRHTAASRSTTPPKRLQHGFFGGVPPITPTNPPSTLAHTSSFRASLGQVSAFGGLKYGVGGLGKYDFGGLGTYDFGGLRYGTGGIGDIYGFGGAGNGYFGGLGDDFGDLCLCFGLCFGFFIGLGGELSQAAATRANKRRFIKRK